MNKVFFTIFVLFTFSLKSYGLCEGKINTGQDLMFQEKDFTKEKYQSNLKLMKSFPREFMVMTDISQNKLHIHKMWNQQIKFSLHDSFDCFIVYRHNGKCITTSVTHLFQQLIGKNIKIFLYSNTWIDNCLITILHHM